MVPLATQPPGRRAGYLCTSLLKLIYHVNVSVESEGLQNALAINLAAYTPLQGLLLLQRCDYEIHWFYLKPRYQKTDSC